MTDLARKDGALVNTNRGAYLAAKAARKKQNEIVRLEDRINKLEKSLAELVERLDERQ
jgi:uncharacterized protein YceH (UPF0502 family)